VLEFVFFEVVNAVTLWIFVKKPFEWVSEPGKVQRFIW
jgi:alpha-1,2-glucosyltransferase